jgi:ElaB/YqjD/DUF883 family membrane-anchored ribosome-binding protein
MNSSNPHSTSTVPNNLQGAAQAVKDKAESIGDALSDRAKAVKENVADAVTSTAQTVGKAWDSTRHAAEDFGSDAARHAEVIHADAVIFIRRNPVATVLGALGVGMLVGAVLFAGTRTR